MNPENPSTIDGFRFGSGRLCFAFTATLGNRGEGAAPVERLDLPSDLDRWIRAAGFKLPVRADSADLDDARRLREAIYRAADARRRGASLPATDVGAINASAARGPVRPELNRAGALQWVGGSVDSVLSHVAADAIGLLTADAPPIRACANPSCGGLFVDASRPGRRRWCSMSTCGNTAKKAAYRARRKQSAGRGDG